MRQISPHSWIPRRVVARRRTIATALCAAIALIAIGGVAIPGGTDSATTKPAGFSVTIDLGSVARVTVLLDVSGLQSHGSAWSRRATESGMSLRLTLALGTLHNISYNTPAKEQTP